VDDIAAFDDSGFPGHLEEAAGRLVFGRFPPLNTQVGLEPGPESERSRLGVEPPPDVSDGSLAGYDHFIRERPPGQDLGDADELGIVFELLLNPGVQVFFDKRSCADKALLRLRTQVFDQKPIGVVGQAPGYAPPPADPQADGLGSVFFVPFLEGFDARFGYLEEPFDVFFVVAQDGELLQPRFSGVHENKVSVPDVGPRRSDAPVMGRRGTPR
jgi:hypothetical protein